MNLDANKTSGVMPEMDLDTATTIYYFDHPVLLCKKINYLPRIDGDGNIEFQNHKPEFHVTFTPEELAEDFEYWHQAAKNSDFVKFVGHRPRHFERGGIHCGTFCASDITRKLGFSRTYEDGERQVYNPTQLNQAKVIYDANQAVLAQAMLEVQLKTEGSLFYQDNFGGMTNFI